MKNCFFLITLCFFSACLVHGDEERCIHGEAKQIDCNTCFCDHGIWGCTKIGCLPSIKSPTPECVDGSTKTIKCNTCVCFFGKWQCTLAACSPRSKRDTLFSCTPGQTFNKQCNTCTCTSDGMNALCTSKKCEAETNSTTVSKKH